jgi:hypothetical protein
MKNQINELHREYQKICNKDPDYKYRVSFKEYRALNDPNRISRIEESQSTEKTWNKARSAPSIWEKLDKDPVYAKHLRDRVYHEDSKGNIEYGDMTLSNRLSTKGARGPK